jgi:hypothetical protein
MSPFLKSDKLAGVDVAKRIAAAVFGLLLWVTGCDGGKGVDPRAASAEPSGHARMLALLEEVRDTHAENNKYLGDKHARSLREQLAKLPAGASAFQRCQLLSNIGIAEMLLGNEREAIERLTEAYELIPAAQAEGMDDRSRGLITFHLGVAYMRLGETANCCKRHTPESCLLPIRGGGIHEDDEGSRNAMRLFTELVEVLPAGSQESLKALWLLNVAAMTLGEYPDGVPERYRVPPEVFESTEAFPRFPNIAGELGINTFSLSGGAIGDDFDGDGLIDLIVSSWDVAGQLRYWHNSGDGTFEERTEQAGLTGLLGGLNMVHADYDNDGDVDFLVLRGAWLFDAGRYPNSLVRNNGDGTFTDVTFEAGLGEVHYPTQTASWADFDNDGDLDLYIGNESSPLLQAPCQLFENNGDGTFTDVAPEAGVANESFTKAVIWGDFDADRYPDLYVSNLAGPNRLYRNNGDGTFVDTAVQAGVTEPQVSFPSWFWDVDNDGDLDLFVSSYAGNSGYLAGAYLGQEVHPALLARLYLGDGRGGFDEVSQAWGLVRPMSPMGSNFGDLDGDGWLDFYLGTGDPAYDNLMPNKMFRNRAGKGFADVTTVGGFGNLQKGHAVVFADFDDDGDVDLFEQMGGAYKGDAYYDSLYENPGFGHRWIAIELVGVQSNRSAIGARIAVEIVEQDGSTRTIYRHVNSGGTFGGNPFRQHIGLGDATGIAQIEIFWPTTGETQRFADVTMDRKIRIEEGSDAL